MKHPQGLRELDELFQNEQIVLEVGLPNCASCNAGKIILQTMEAGFPRVVFAWINADEFELFCEARCIQSAPTFLFLRGGYELARLAGGVSVKVLREEVKHWFRE